LGRALRPVRRLLLAATWTGKRRPTWQPLYTPPRLMRNQPMKPRDLGIGRLFESIRDAVIVAEATTGRIVLWNPAATEIFGYSSSEALEMNVEALVPGRLKAQHREGIARYQETGHGRYVDSRKLLESPAVKQDGAEIWIEMSLSPIEPTYGPGLEGRRFVLAIVRDVTERKVLEERLSHQAFHDSLTGLPNRPLFVERLEHSLRRKTRNGRYVAVLFMDLDNFKDINDSLGHEAGDRLLVAVAKRLRGCLRDADTLARFGGDEFVVLIDDATTGTVSSQLAERLLECLALPFAVAGERVFVSASIGVAQHAPFSSDRWDVLLSRADVAMYEAKRQDKARYATYDPAARAHNHDRLRTVNDLRVALERGEFLLHYQPEVDLRTGAISHMEALVRWHHPRRGLVLPAEFVPLAEEIGLIVPLGRWVLEEACAQVRRWQDLYPRTSPLVADVNLSAKQFRQPDLAGDVSKILRKTGLDPACLELEITEGVLMEDAPMTGAVLKELKALGVRVAVDDFGTGYSSLSYLKRFPMDTLKIDRAFVGGLGTDPEDEALVSGIIGLAHALGLDVVAEGVETERQVASLKEMGCGLAQGYHFSRPLSDEAATPVLAKGTLP
jgi:diguanylate cyclase (GGDEF)-like protein/PAS domain S-box-containing protein